MNHETLARPADGGLRPVTVRYRPRVPQPRLLDHLRRNLKSGVPDLEPGAPRAEPLIVAGGGPSLIEGLSTLERSVRAGAKILAVNEVPHLLIRKRIMPWGAVHIGPVDLTLAALGDPVAGLRYFIASICPPQVLERLHSYDVVLWHPTVDGATAAIHATGVDPRAGFVDGGQTVSLRALTIGAILGFRAIKFHGGDSSFDDGEAHAYRSVSDREGYERLTVMCGDRDFETTPELLGQALAFPGLRKTLAERGVAIDVYGSGLLPFREERRQQDGTEPPVMLAEPVDCGLDADGRAVIEAMMF